MSAAERHYTLAEAHLRAAETYPVTLDGEGAWLDHANRVELMLGAVVHALLFVGCVEATRATPTPLVKLDATLRKTLRDD